MAGDRMAWAADGMEEMGKWEGHHDSPLAPTWCQTGIRQKEKTESNLVRRGKREENTRKGKWIRIYIRLRVRGITIYLTYKSFVLET